MCFLLSTHFLQSKRLNWVIWTILGAFGMGITITNIIALTIVFFISNYSINSDLSVSIKKTILLLSITTFITFTFSMGSSLLIGKKPLSADIKVLRLNLVVPGLNLIGPGSLTITGKEECRQKQGLQLAA